MRLIRKYANRRLYDTEESRYIVLSDLRDLVMNNIDFEVKDSKTGEDLTNTILLQIIIEQENIASSNNAQMFSNDILRKFINMYGDGFNNYDISGYLKKTLDIFYEQQKMVQENFRQAIKLSNITQKSTNPNELVKQMIDQNKILWDTVLKNLNMENK